MKNKKSENEILNINNIQIDKDFQGKGGSLFVVYL